MVQQSGSGHLNLDTPLHQPSGAGIGSNYRCYRFTEVPQQQRQSVGGDMERASSQASARIASSSLGAASSDALPLRRLGHVPALDGLRGVTVIIVFGSHQQIILPLATFAAIPGGTVALDMFFVLSGFLITTYLLWEQGRNGRINFGAFYQRRGFRLLPALAGVLIGQAVFAGISGISFHKEWTSVLSVVFYYSNWNMAFHSNAFGPNIATGLQHMWSLSVEEQFYLVWPWLTMLLSVRVRLRIIAPVLTLGIIGIALHRGLMYSGANWYATFTRTDTRADAILLGCLLAHIWVRGWSPKKFLRPATWLAAGFLVICLVVVSPTGPFLFWGGLVGIDLACGIVIIGILDSRWSGTRLCSWRPIVVIGTVSYALYLWHIPVLFAVRYLGNGWAYPVRVIVAIAATGVFTTLSWFLLERPAQRWNLRINERRKARVASVGVPLRVAAADGSGGGSGMAERS